MMKYKLKLRDAIIPCCPFLWYREREIVCPIEYIGKCDNKKLNLKLKYIRRTIFNNRYH